jgi:uncharacterized protein YggE
MSKKTRMFWGGILTFVFATLIVFNPLANNVAEAASETAFRTITVFGEGIVKGKPDLAYISLGVQNEAQTANAAQKNNAQTMQKIINSLEQLGMSEEDMQTSRYSVYPFYSYGNEDREPKLAGYRANSTVTVKVKQIDRIGELIDAGVKAGANNVEEIRFTIEDNQALLLDALEAAAKDARAKAWRLANVMGTPLKQVRTIEEIGVNSSDFVGRTELLQNVSAKDGGYTPVIPGSITVKMQVKIIYDL